jgi:hypothetical protein
MDEMLSESRGFGKGAFEDDPYYKNIQFHSERSGNFHLENSYFDTYELFTYDEPKEKDGMMIPRFGFFDHKYTFPVLAEGNMTWMTITPNEMNSMKNSINEAKGNVLTLGLGLGYWPYMVSLKPDVTHVTVIEREPDVIELFKRYILPQFENGDKIEIIQTDAIDYMEKLPDGKFDYCFADLWPTNSDISPYLLLKHTCRKFKKMKVSFWVEDSLVYYMVGHVLNRIFSVFNDDDWLDECSHNDIISILLSDAVIDSPSKVDYYMDIHNLMKLI